MSFSSGGLSAGISLTSDLGVGAHSTSLERGRQLLLHLCVKKHRGRAVAASCHIRAALFEIRRSIPREPCSGERAHLSRGDYTSHERQCDLGVSGNGKLEVSLADLLEVYL